MKKYVLLCASIFTATSTLDETGSSSPFVLKGAYIGAGIGVAIAHHTKSRFAWDDARIPAFSQSFNPSLVRYSPALAILAGYGWRLKNYHIGVETDYLFSNINAKFNLQAINFPNSNSPAISVNSYGAWGVAVRLGYHWDRLMVFTRFGLENRRFKLSGTTASNLGAAGISRNTMSFRINKTAFAPGAGIEVKINKNIHAAFEYRIALYRTINKSLKTIEGITSSKIDPRVSSLLVSLRYCF